jgi:hypothetical protein
MKRLLSKLNGTYQIELGRWSLGTIAVSIALSFDHPLWLAAIPIELWCCTKVVSRG